MNTEKDGRRKGRFDAAARAREKELARAEDDAALALDPAARERLRRENGGGIAAIVRGSRILRRSPRDDAAR